MKEFFTVVYSFEEKSPSESLKDFSPMGASNLTVNIPLKTIEEDIYKGSLNEHTNLDLYLMSKAIHLIKGLEYTQFHPTTISLAEFTVYAESKISDLVKVPPVVQNLDEITASLKDLEIKKRELCEKVVNLFFETHPYVISVSVWTVSEYSKTTQRYEVNPENIEIHLSTTQVVDTGVKKVSNIINSNEGDNIASVKELWPDLYTCFVSTQIPYLVDGQNLFYNPTERYKFQE